LIALSVASATGPVVAAGGALSDPTRPPEAALESEVMGGTATSAQLQSVLIAPGRTLAVINGKTVRLGARYGEARLVKVTESAVVLRHADRDETLKLLPGVEKESRRKPATPRPMTGGK